MSKAGRSILVTGGTNGIGRAVAESFAEAGDQVVVWGRDAGRIAQINSVKESNIAAKKVDVSKSDEIKQGMESFVAEHGTIDVLVNAAGFTKPVSTKVPYKEAIQTWNELLATNLTGSFLVAHAAAEHITRPGGRIVMIGSIAAFTGSTRPGGLGYAASKSGINGLTIALARELGPEGITVNEVAPGFIEETGLTSGYDPEVIERIMSQTPVGHPGTVEDIAAAVMYLASPQAGFVNGEIHHVNGGWLPGR